MLESTKARMIGGWMGPVLALFAGALGACSSDSESANGTGGTSGAGGSGGSPPECAELLPTCLTDQKACVLGTSGPMCQPCPLGEYAADDGTCTTIPGSMLEHAFPPFTSQPGEEQTGTCRSWTLDNDSVLWVNAVELLQDEASHHSNWTFVPESEFAGPDGLWDCDERGYNQLSAALVGGVLYAQSTQAKKEVQKFPDGVVIRVPARSRIISSAHILNTGTDPVTGNVTLRVYSIPEEQVKVKLAPFHLSYDGLDIPPLSRSRFSGECDIEAQFQSTGGTPLDMQIYFILPHTHALGVRFFTEIVGGPNDGVSLIDLDGFNEEGRGRRYAPPIDAAGAKGFRFGCEFDNPRSEKVGWGFGDQEMCECLGFADSRLAFESRIDTAVPDGEENGVQKFTGECSTIAFDWESKQGP
jgi:hypothetical protein